MNSSEASLLEPGSISLDGTSNTNARSLNIRDEDTNNATEAMLDGILDAPPLPSSRSVTNASDFQNQKAQNATATGAVDNGTTWTSTSTATTKSSPGKAKTKTSVFDRLYSSHTASSRSHYNAAAAAAATTSNTSGGTTPNSATKMMKRSYARPSPKAQHLTPTKLNYGGTVRSPVKDRGIKSPAAVPRSATGRQHSMEYSIRMKPLTKLYFISKFHPGVGLEPIEPIKMGYTFFQSFCDYESGAINGEQISKEIIVAFFKQDFPSGRHWQMNEPEVSPMTTNTANNGGGNSSNNCDTRSSTTEAYLVSMSATYDWEDAYRVATARGVVRFKVRADGNKEIRVENYAYDLTGDP